MAPLISRKQSSASVALAPAGFDGLALPDRAESSQASAKMVTETRRAWQRSSSAPAGSSTGCAPFARVASAVVRSLLPRSKTRNTLPEQGPQLELEELPRQPPSERSDSRARRLVRRLQRSEAVVSAADLQSSAQKDADHKASSRRDQDAAASKSRHTGGEGADQAVHEAAFLRRMLILVYDQDLSVQAVEACVEACPELAWLSHCARICPLPPNWKKTSDKKVGNRDGPRYINKLTNEDFFLPPRHDMFVLLGRLVAYACVQPAYAPVAATCIQQAADDWLKEAKCLSFGWTGPHHDAASGREYFHEVASGRSAWNSPAAVPSFAACAAMRLLDSVVFAALPAISEETEDSISLRNVAVAAEHKEDIADAAQPKTMLSSDPASGGRLIDEALAMAGTPRLLAELQARGIQFVLHGRDETKRGDRTVKLGPSDQTGAAEDPGSDLGKTRGRFGGIDAQNQRTVTVDEPSSTQRRSGSPCQTRRDSLLKGLGENVPSVTAAALTFASSSLPAMLSEAVQSAASRFEDSPKQLPTPPPPSAAHVGCDSGSSRVPEDAAIMTVRVRQCENAGSVVPGSLDENSVEAVRSPATIEKCEVPLRSVSAKVAKLLTHKLLVTSGKTATEDEDTSDELEPEQTRKAVVAWQTTDSRWQKVSASPQVFVQTDTKPERSDAIWAPRQKAMAAHGQTPQPHRQKSWAPTRFGTIDSGEFEDAEEFGSKIRSLSACSTPEKPGPTISRCSHRSRTATAPVLALSQIPRSLASLGSFRSVSSARSKVCVSSDANSVEQLSARSAFEPPTRTPSVVARFP